MNSTDMAVTIFVRDERGKRWTIDLSDTEYQCITAQQLKGKIRLLTGEPEHEQRLIFQSRELKGSEQLCHLGVIHSSTIDMQKILRGGGLGPGKEDGGMGDKTGKNRSMEKLANF